MASLIEIRGVSKTYQRGQQSVEVLHHVDLDITEGDFVALMGPSGSGKTTLLNLIAGLDRPSEGSIAIRGERIDGLGETALELVFPGQNRPRWMNLTIAYFSIPQRDHDSAYARQYNAPGGRGAVVKPAHDGMLGVHIGIQKRPESEHTWSAAEQRAFIHAQFSGLGWEFPRIIQAMEKVDDFYFDVLRQVRMPRWSNGRVVLTGDAAWCPTALSGIGTTLALVGGYVLAGELSKADTPSAAFARYEQIMRPFVEEGQNIPKLLPRLLWPHTRVGLAVLRGAMHIAGSPVFKKFINDRFARDSRSIVLPRYE
ncbi:ATP-binding cassette domain-containing protein [Xanthomonas citri pv. glycines]|uniref:Oxidoreductase n=1 Tax=Xanthomonas campestris pv. glycines TaxID=473421 RepID=A0AAX0I244_XANCG|nr:MULTISPECIES: ATP-binding cassette domain-containing protein [Xanthomonas]ARV23165.1 oxidoreductase [Xanthomonas citri pv. glycines str. 12-2]EWC52696.1 oxidoreductase [Xanthomonas citri pv. glycines str. 8ra]OEY90558.1 oxidoreductase [Xanthomonas citri pv. glycines]OOX05510.1 oxidoreductase [Xanthomonas citri pv. glycines]QTK36771.1 ATP-binding cassette domain-containing protein [Xanthomonas citri pv. glycines CFBP 2526]